MGGRVLIGLGLVCALGGCSDDNVHAAPSCPVVGCGGDVVGDWEIVEACIVEEDCSDESGSVTGTFSFTADGYSYDWLIETRGCGFQGEHEAGGGGSYRAEGNFLYRGADELIFEYCVDGDTLELHNLDQFGDGERFTLHRVNAELTP